VGEGEDGGVFDFLEAVEVELADEAAELVVAVVVGQDFGFEFFLVQHVYFSFALVQLDDGLEVSVLRGGGGYPQDRVKFGDKAARFRLLFHQYKM
jgi:hypothetical protein